MESVDAIKSLYLEVTYETDLSLRIRITDPVNKRWEVPNIVKTKGPVSSNSTSAYKIEYKASPFSITVTRVSDGKVVWNSVPLFYSNQVYIYVTSTRSSYQIICA